MENSNKNRIHKHYNIATEGALQQDRRKTLTGQTGYHTLHRRRKRISTFYKVETEAELQQG